jgi:P27 family predicted phage terminase small subunit
VELLATSYGQFLDAAAKVVQGGPVWIGKSKDGSLPKCVASPWVKIMDRSWKQIKEMLTEFGMTPSSRLIGDRPPDAGDDFDAFVRSKR